MIHLTAINEVTYLVAVTSRGQSRTPAPDSDSVAAALVSSFIRRFIVEQSRFRKRPMERPPSPGCAHPGRFLL